MEDHVETPLHPPTHPFPFPTLAMGVGATRALGRGECSPTGTVPAIMAVARHPAAASREASVKGNCGTESALPVGGRGDDDDHGRRRR